MLRVGDSIVNGAWSTTEGVNTLLAAIEGAALALELSERHFWKRRGRVMLGLIDVNLVNREGVVDNVGLEDISLDNRLDSLVNIYAY